MKRLRIKNFTKSLRTTSSSWLNGEQYSCKLRKRTTARNQHTQPDITWMASVLGVQRFRRMWLSQRSQSLILDGDVKLQNRRCLIQSAAKIIHIITHECKWALWNHKSLRFPTVFYLWKVCSNKIKISQVLSFCIVSSTNDIQNQIK